MAFKKIITFGKTRFEGIGRLRNFKMGSVNTPITCELHEIPDLETYRDIQDQERGFLINEDGTPKLNAEGKKIGVVSKMDYDEIVKVKQLNSRNIDPEKDQQFRNDLAKLFYKYFGEGEEI